MKVGICDYIAQTSQSDKLVIHLGLMDVYYT